MPITSRKQLLQSQSHLSEQQFFRPQLPHQGLQLCSAYIVSERTQVELRCRTVQNGDAKGVSSICAIGAFLFTDGYAMARLVVGK